MATVNQPEYDGLGVRIIALVWVWTLGLVALVFVLAAGTLYALTELLGRLTFVKPKREFTFFMAYTDALKWWTGNLGYAILGSGKFSPVPPLPAPK